MSRLVLSCLVLSCLVLSCLVSSRLVLSWARVSCGERKGDLGVKITSLPQGHSGRERAAAGGGGGRRRRRKPPQPGAWRPPLCHSSSQAHKTSTQSHTKQSLTKPGVAQFSPGWRTPGRARQRELPAVKAVGRRGGGSRSRSRRSCVKRIEQGEVREENRAGGVA